MAVQTKELSTVPVLQTGGKVSPIVPQTWNEAVQMAGAFVRAGMVPKHYEGNVEKATVAILAGLEVGLTPMSALQSIAVINNMPTIYGDGMLGLIRASGFLEDIEEGVEYNQKGEPVSATCRVKRKGEKTWGVHMFTIDDAHKGGLTGKPGPWKQYPQRMLQMRARAWALRDKFADVLKGLKSAEEVQDMVDITPQGGAVVSAVEPKRGDFVDEPTTASAPAAPQPTGDAAPAKEQPAPAAGTKKAPTITDVEDQNEKPAAAQPDAPQDGKPADDDPDKLEFDAFGSEKMRGPKAFFEFSDHFLQESRTTAEMAKRWEEFYRDAIKKMAASKTTAVAEGMAETLGFYSAALARERVPGEDG
jgi:hypothetical protein